MIGNISTTSLLLTQLRLHTIATNITATTTTTTDVHHCDYYID